MEPIVTTARIRCKSREAREKVLEAFHKIVEYSEEKEKDGVNQYIVTVPVNDEDGTDVWMIEAYTSRAHNHSHIETPPVQELLHLFSDPAILAQSPEVHTLPISSHKPSKPHPITSSLAIVLAFFEYKPQTLSHALEGWKNVVSYVFQHEAGTIGYTVMGSDEENAVRTVEIYESWKFLENVHMTNPAIGANQEQNGEDRTGKKEVVRLQPLDGFFGR